MSGTDAAFPGFMAMRKITLVASLATAALLAACRPAGDTSNVAGPASSGAEQNVVNGGVAAVPPADVGINDARDRDEGATPPTLTPEAERGIEGARNVLRTFARALERREFAQAWSLLSAADRQKWSREEFAALFADLPQVSVAIPDGTMEGAAGSSYYTAPVAITGNDREGRPVRIEGAAVLRRVNDVDGATPAQLRWHFERLTLDWTH